MKKCSYPCMGCTVETGRSATCHSTCERYLEAVSLNKDIEEKRKRAIAGTVAFYAYSVDRKARFGKV